MVVLASGLYICLTLIQKWLLDKLVHRVDISDKCFFFLQCVADVFVTHSSKDVAILTEITKC